MVVVGEERGGGGGGEERWVSEEVGGGFWEEGREARDEKRKVQRRVRGREGESDGKDEP